MWRLSHSSLPSQAPHLCTSHMSISVCVTNRQVLPCHGPCGTPLLGHPCCAQGLFSRCSANAHWQSEWTNASIFLTSICNTREICNPIKQVCRYSCLKKCSIGSTQECNVVLLHLFRNNSNSFRGHDMRHCLYLHMSKGNLQLQTRSQTFESPFERSYYKQWA